MRYESGPIALVAVVRCLVWVRSCVLNVSSTPSIPRVDTGLVGVVGHCTMMENALDKAIEEIAEEQGVGQHVVVDELVVNVSPRPGTLPSTETWVIFYKEYKSTGRNWH